MTISKKLEKAINEQITAEMWSANLYMAMSFFCEKEGFSGFGNWLKKQSNEEISHAYMMADFLIKRGGTAKMGKIDEVPGTWKKPIDMFKKVYEHECTVSEMINTLLDLSIEENDKAAQDFFWQFVREQVEEEATASDIVSKIETANRWKKKRRLRILFPRLKNSGIRLCSCSIPNWVNASKRVWQGPRP